MVVVAALVVVLLLLLLLLWLLLLLLLLLVVVLLLPLSRHDRHRGDGRNMESVTPNRSRSERLHLGTVR